MSKVICEICGTTYQESADCCPICGCSRNAAADLLGGDLLMEDIAEDTRARAGRFASSNKKKEIFDFDEVNPEDEDEEAEIEEEENPYEDEEEYEEEPRHNTFAVIALTVIIVALLAAAGFVFVKYFLPNMGGEDETIPVTTVQKIEETTVPTTEFSIPCQGLALVSGGEAVISKEGNYHLINVIASPADTTDEIIFTSADESIATVTEDGRVTAVSQGETVIYITCGDNQVTCKVICRFEEETVPPTEETTGAEETVAETAAPDVVLKLKKNDIMLGVYYQYQLVLDCDLQPDQVEWSSEHPYIATVDEMGVVTAVKSGTTAIIAKYGDQEVQCIVRCN